MIATIEQWPKLQEEVARDLRTSECKTVLVFVSGADVDAVAAARTLKVRTQRSKASLRCCWLRPAACSTRLPDLDVAPTLQDVSPTPGAAGSERTATAGHL